MKTLQLNLIKEWFDLTLQGIKKEEYRDITPHWASRLMCMENGTSISNEYSKEEIITICEYLRTTILPEVIMGMYGIKFRTFPTTDFRNGYQSLDKVPRFIIENKGIAIGEGKAEWGCKSNDNFFIIHHGEVLETFNIK